MLLFSAYFIYSKGNLVSVAIARHNMIMPTQTLTHGRVTWINIIHPTLDDVDTLRERYPYIHPLNLEDVQSRMERPKIDKDEDYLFAIMHFPLWDQQKSLSRPKEVDFFVGRGYVVTIHDDSLMPLQRLWENAVTDEDARERLLGRGANHAFYTIIDQLVDYIFPILRKVDGNIRRLEEDIFTVDTQQNIREISLVRRDVIVLRRIIRHQVPIVEQFEQIEHPILRDELEEYFGDIADHLQKQRDIIDEDYEIISSLAETADTLASHRINEVMRILTVISVIMLPLTLISSVYGMNVDLPLQGNPNGFWYVSLAMFFIGILLLIYFRRRNWL